MNSDQLREKFNEHYEELFANYDLVLSLPYVISIFWWTACVFGWPVINQSIPQRAYIGLKKNKIETWIQIISYKRINYKTKQLEQVKNDPFYAPDNCFIEQINILLPDAHADISIITEFEGKNADLISGWMILWLDILYEKIDKEMIQLLKKSNCEIFHQDEYVKSLLKNTLLLRMNYNKSTVGWSSLDTFVGLIDSDLPVMHIQEKDLYSIDNETVGKKEIFEKIKDSEVLYITKRTEELSNVEFNKELPFDIMMFGLWDYRNIWWYQTFLNWWENSKWMKELLRSDNSKISDSFFLEISGKNHLLHKSIEVISAYIFHVTKVFMDTFSAKEKVSTLFFYLRRNIELINTLLGKYNLSSYEWEDSDTFSLESLLKTLYPDIRRDDYFIYTTGSSIDLKYVVLIQKSLSTFPEEYINLELQKKFNKAVSLIYSSKNDGFAKEWLKIEQFLSNEIYSKNGGEKRIILANQNGSIILCSNQEEAFVKSKLWILLDTINKKIFINGEKLNSKDLLSQNATVDVLSLLLENLWKEIESSSLPRSGYSKNKNEMVWKIIIPLLKLIEQKLGYHLPLICKGNTQEFYLKLDKPEIDIFVLKKR